MLLSSTAQSEIYRGGGGVREMGNRMIPEESDPLKARKNCLYLGAHGYQSRDMSLHPASRKTWTQSIDVGLIDLKFVFGEGRSLTIVANKC